jgi:hypothetical protein
MSYKKTKLNIINKELKIKHEFRNTCENAFHICAHMFLFVSLIVLNQDSDLH